MSTRNRNLVPLPTKRAPRQPPESDEPVFTRYPPVINHPPEAWHHQVPYPYRFKWDGGWIFVLFLALGGLAGSPLMGQLGGFIAFMRCLVWCSFQFPLTTLFFVSFLSGLLGGGRRRRW